MYGSLALILNSLIASYYSPRTGSCILRRSSLWPAFWAGAHCAVHSILYYINHADSQSTSRAQKKNQRHITCCFTMQMDAYMVHLFYYQQSPGWLKKNKTLLNIQYLPHYSNCRLTCRGLTIMPWKAKRQYMLTLQVSDYFISKQILSFWLCRAEYVKWVKGWLRLCQSSKKICCFSKLQMSIWWPF